MPSETQLREIFNALGDGLFIASAEGHYVDVNPAACAMLGYGKDELLALSLPDVLDPSECMRLPEAIAAYDDGNVHRTEWRFRRKDGTIFTGELVGGRLPDGRLQGMVRDISERIHRDMQEQLLRREATHRTKNILAVVQSLARQTAKSSTANFIAAFEERLAALANSHDLFARNAWGETDLQELVNAQLAAYQSSTTRIAMSGPPVRLSVRAAQTIGMALHELATNAVKYGALSQSVGRVSIHWAIATALPQSTFRLTWLEDGGPTIKEPEHTGFGMRLIARIPESALGARSSLEFASQGLSWTIECPLAALTKA